ncbi:MAG: hypothetical protein K5622_02340 [Endomicrobiaceae bacterium]|nr:hypothetical protein [Endomicrobiaceae bacterium]
MKKFFSLLAVMALVVMASSSVWADAFATKKAYVTFSSEALTFNVKIYDFVADQAWDAYTGTEATSISFDTTGITLGSATPFNAMGQTIAIVSSNLTAQQAGTTVYMYTRNNSDTGAYKANAARTETWGTTEVTLFNGLARKGNTSTYQVGDLAPIKIKCAKSSEASTAALPADFWSLDASSGVRMVLDKNDSIFASYPDNAKVIGKSGATGGIWVGYGDSGYGTSDWYANEKVIIFFEAQFTNVMGGSEYGTETITFNQAVE